MNWNCNDCNVDTHLEYYSVLEEIWDEFGVGEGNLCIGCLEQRMGRLLDRRDFIDCILNQPDMGWEKSARLLDRITPVV